MSAPESASPQIADEVIAILAAQALLDPAEIALDAGLEDLGLDSLGLVEAIFAIEERFDISVPFNPQEPEANDGFLTASIASVIQDVTRLIAARRG